jgi:hypothetical protein
MLLLFLDANSSILWDANSYVRRFCYCTRATMDRGMPSFISLYLLLISQNWKFYLEFHYLSPFCRFSLQSWTRGH